MKYINFKRYKFSTVFKIYHVLWSNFLKLFKFIHFKRYNFTKVYRYFDIRRFNFTKIVKLFDLRTYNFFQIKRKISFFSSKFLLVHLPASIIFFGLLYFVIPTFYNYDKSNIEKLICKGLNVECSIGGKVNYNFLPTPRINIKDLTINDNLKGKNTLIKAKKTSIKLSIKNLLAKEKHKFRKIQINDYEINLNLKNHKKYKNIFTKKTDIIPIAFEKGKIVFFDEENYVSTVDKTNLDLKLEKDSIEVALKGKFLGDNLYVDLSSSKEGDKISTDFLLKLKNLNLLTKANFFNFEKDSSVKSGNILVKIGKNKMTSIFDFKNNEFIIKKSNLRNTFIDGKMKGKITLLPYFNFDLDLNLNSLNFTRMYNNFLSLDKEEQKQLLKINKKINGDLHLSADKIYSGYNLAKSFESRLKFNNGNILIEQFLLNMGKLGAADLLGTIKNDKKFTSLKFESNIFVDNEKKFLSKFGIYAKKSIPSSLFISGNVDLENLRTTFYEISGNEKLKENDINFIEEEFNDLMFENGYETLFSFRKFKDFIKSITEDVN
tara:strand:- start:5250 stop:6890 length:1641 start_codon:yes stop_codon:yes gene_type:complete